MSKKSLLNKFVERGAELQFSFNISEVSAFRYEPLTNDALFHLPLIAICVLTVAKDQDSKVSAGQMGRLVGLLIENTISGFKGSSQLLGWSSTLRYRTAEAISFLEQVKLIEVSKDRKITITEDGNKFLLNVRREESELGVAVRALIRRAPELELQSEKLI